MKRPRTCLLLFRAVSGAEQKIRSPHDHATIVSSSLVPGKMTSSAIVACLLLHALANANRNRRWTATPADDLQPLFEARTEGWLGGDVATSIPLGNDRFLWLFGGTVIGKREGDTRVAFKGMPHNTVATVVLPKGASPTQNDVNFYWRTRNGKPTAIFEPPKASENDTFYWVVAGLKSRESDALFLLAQRVQHTDDERLNFKVLGSTAIVVKNATGDDPTTWQYESQDMPPSTNGTDWFAAISYAECVACPDEIADDSFYGIADSVYLLGRNETSSAILARAKLDDLIQFNYDSFQVYANTSSTPDATWLPWRDVIVTGRGQPVALFRPALAECTVSYHRDLELWYVVAVRLFDYRIDVWTASNVTGPWTSTLVYEIPTPWRNTTKYLNYAAKSHPELVASSSDEIVFSYMTNSWRLGVLFEPDEVRTYVPRFVRLRYTDELAAWELVVLIIAFAFATLLLVVALVCQRGGGGDEEASTGGKTDGKEGSGTGSTEGNDL